MCSSSFVSPSIGCTRTTAMIKATMKKHKRTSELLTANRTFVPPHEITARFPLDSNPAGAQACGEAILVFPEGQRCQSLGYPRCGRLPAFAAAIGRQVTSLHDRWFQNLARRH